MDLGSVDVQLAVAKKHVDWKSWLTNTEEYEPYDDFSGILEMKATAVLQSGNGTKVIGRCELWLISRDKMCYGAFGEQVNKISKHAAFLSQSIFDDYGDFMEDVNDFGGLDLNKSDMILLENIWVDKDHRKQGVARKMLREAQKEIAAEVDTCFMIAYPRVVAEDVDESLPQEEKHKKSAERWGKTLLTFDALGFRKISTSPYWIYDPDSRYDERAEWPTEELERRLNWTPERGLTFFLP